MDLSINYFRQIIEEERLLQALCQYYSSDDLYIPPRLPGNPLPNALEKFYNDLVKESIETAEREKIRDSINTENNSLSLSEKKKLKKKPDRTE